MREVKGQSISFLKSKESFPGGLVVKNLPANAGDMGSIPDPGRFHDEATKPLSHMQRVGHN